MTDKEAQELLDLLRQYVRDYEDDDPTIQENTIADTIEDLAGSLG